MNQEKKPEALRLADQQEAVLLDVANGRLKPAKIPMEPFVRGYAELRRLHALAESQRTELVAEASRTAEEKLRADQVTDQHRMQCNISKSAVATLVGLGYTDKGGEQWAPPIGKAPDFNLLDAANAQIAELQAQLSAIGAGGVESLRERDDAEDEGDAADEWRRLALQFDEHRMLALWHLRRLVRTDDGYPEAKEAEQFLASPPLPGEAVLAQRIAALAAAPAQAVASSITIDFKQAAELLEMFGGEPAEVTLIEGPGHSGEGLYAYYSDLPEEGAEFLGKPDNEALPATPAQEHATQLAGQAGEQDEGLAQAIDERDTAEGWADGLAGLIGAYFGQDIGEHSSAHNPWQEAKDIIEEAEPYRSAAVPAQAHKDEQA